MGLGLTTLQTRSMSADDPTAAMKVEQTRVAGAKSPARTADCARSSAISFFARRDDGARYRLLFIWKLVNVLNVLEQRELIIFHRPPQPSMRFGIARLAFYAALATFVSGVSQSRFMYVMECATTTCTRLTCAIFLSP